MVYMTFLYGSGTTGVIPSFGCFVSDGVLGPSGGMLDERPNTTSTNHGSEEWRFVMFLALNLGGVLTSSKR